MEFFGKTRKELLYPLTKSENDYNKFKRRIFPSHEIKHDDLYNKYKNSDYYLTMTSFVNDNWFRQIRNPANINNNLIYKAIDNQMLCKSDFEILDYGCGHGLFGLYFTLLGFNVTLADIPTKHFEFLKFLCNKYKINVKFYDVPPCDNMDFPEQYDYIINSEVMEHCNEPVTVMISLINAMKYKSKMYLSTFFDDCGGNDTTHLLKNVKRYQDPKVWYPLIERLGLDLIDRCPNGIPKIYMKK